MTQKEQTRLTELRLRELAGQLTKAEESELAGLMATIEQVEIQYLSPALERMQAEQAVLRERIEKLHQDNEELAGLLNQQEQLATEARRWLAEFEKRHSQIQETYTRLTGEVLTPT
ncbi:MAG: hypothetical protein L0332_10295 [Chloroflexi bacterium]|nr:hypothetical protein [Chloroflexota bacterium]MCI0576056.1 hypothetical protein [Chloroflexota bacterium]MCI0647844.1 hypothetical protein [Chloroflexota bacterium]MCI0727095.1 hypothetical protein [Chloroflexota bacterium]